MALLGRLSMQRCVSQPSRCLRPQLQCQYPTAFLVRPATTKAKGRPATKSSVTSAAASPSKKTIATTTRTGSKTSATKASAKTATKDSVATMATATTKKASSSTASSTAATKTKKASAASASTSASTSRKKAAATTPPPPPPQAVSAGQQQQQGTTTAASTAGAAQGASTATATATAPKVVTLEYAPSQVAPAARRSPVDTNSKEYKSAYRRVTALLVALPFLIVTSYALYDRLILGNVRTLPDLMKSDFLKTGGGTAGPGSSGRKADREAEAT